MVIIALAQTQSVKGDIEQNLAIHLRCIEEAAHNQASAIFFPELSLTGYEPELAESLAMDYLDSRLNVLQEFANEHDITIGIGAPTRHPDGIRISMIIFQPDQPRNVYSKQWLHEDELPYFTPGNQPVIIQVGDQKIAPGICYEALQSQHFEQMKAFNPTVYLASVAKHERGVKQAYHYLSNLAKENDIPVLFCNAMGPSDNFVSAGQSAVWTAKGELSFKMRPDEWKNKLVLAPIKP